MLKDLAEKYYFDGDYNCAETVLLSGNEYYNLGLTADDTKLIAAFGGGLGCGRTCGAIAGAMAILGKLKVTGNAHATEDFSATCAILVDRFEEKMGCINCSVLKEKYHNEEEKCIPTVKAACDILEEYLKEI